MDQNARQQIIERLKSANNVLVTVSANPSVDQLASCIGFTLLLNHLGKHATAVFSGEVPSTIEFLKPEETLEKNTDSLRDFIIALDKSKADKLRYKVEDKVVKIFITPYRTSLSQQDLQFSQGDFNVDAVVAIGVHERTDIDKAIMAHGRILHDATVISISNKVQGDIGAINLVDPNASSLAEILVELTKGLSTDKLDGQMATSFMTGIVAETDRFSNTKTSPRTMAIAAELMTAGANQQLIASKLETASLAPVPKTDSGTPSTEGEQPATAADGSLQIEHEKKDEPAADKPAEDQPKADDKDVEISSIINNSSITTDSSPPKTDEPTDTAANNDEAPKPLTRPTSNTMALQPPTMGGRLTANSEPDSNMPEQTTDPLSLASGGASTTAPQILNRPANLYGKPIQPANSFSSTDTATPASAPTGPVPSATEILRQLGQTDNTINGIGSSVDSSSPSPGPSSIPDSSSNAPQTENLEEAREAVDQAIASEPSSQALEPLQSMGSQPFDAGIQNSPTPPAPTANPMLNPVGPTMFTPPPVSTTPPTYPMMPSASPSPSGLMTPSTANPLGPPPDMNGVNPNPSNPNVPDSLMPKSLPTDPTAASGNPTAPPPVPPPLMPPTDSTNANAPL